MLAALPIGKALNVTSIGQRVYREIHRKTLLDTLLYADSYIPTYFIFPTEVEFGPVWAKNIKYVFETRPRVKVQGTFYQRYRAKLLTNKIRFSQEPEAFVAGSQAHKISTEMQMLGLIF